MMTLRFRSVIKINGINPYVLVSATRAARIHKGWRKPLPVCVRVNGQPEKPWRINLMPIGDGSFYLYLHGDVRKASGTKVGDTITVELEFDDEYRGGPAHPMPPTFRAALKKNQRAAQAWRELTPSRQKEILRYFFHLKSPEAQARNLERAIHVLSGGKGRFMGRFWNGNKSPQGRPKIAQDKASLRAAPWVPEPKPSPRFPAPPGERSEYIGS